MRKLQVTYLPFDRVSRVPPGTTLFNAAHWIGLPIESTCGGRGTCGKCKVQVLAGEHEVTAADRRKLGADELDQGWRLACQARVHTDATCRVAQLQRPPRAATMGINRLVVLEPNVHRVRLQLPEPSLLDARSDLERLTDALDEEGYGVAADPPALRDLPGALRAAGFAPSVVICGEHLVAVEPGDASDDRYGVAIDIGTTTVVGALMDLRGGMPVAVDSTLNRQAPFGADVISRIAHAMSDASALGELQREVVATINDVLAHLYAASGVSPLHVYELVAVGNATMLHLLLGIDPRPISFVPFVPAFRGPLELGADQAGLAIHPRGRVATLPLVGAYVGADIVAGVLATGLAREERLRLFVDVGTNGEIVLGSSERALVTAAPAGPAFEGGGISCGMRASDGAIEAVSLGDEVRLEVIGGGPPRGLCGSGLVDAAAQLRRVGLLDASGRLKAAADVPGHPLAGRLVERDGTRAFLLHEGVPLTQRDIRELQAAKGSIATGVAALMETLGVGADDLDEVILAGSFGTSIDPESARAIGLVPPVPVERITPAGNSAIEGAKMALLSFREREIAAELPSRLEYVELSARPGFNELFVASTRFPEPEAVA